MTTLFIILALIVTAIVTWYVTKKIENDKIQRLTDAYNDLLDEKDALANTIETLTNEIVSLKAKQVVSKISKTEETKSKSKKQRNTKKSK